MDLPRKTPLFTIPPSNQVDTCLQIMKNWLCKQPHLPQTITDEDLLSFLHATRYRTEKTKLVIDAHYTIRTNTDIFSQRDLSNPTFREVFNIISFFDLPGTTSDGEKVMLFKFLDPTVSKFDYINCTRYSFAMYDVMVQKNKTVPGYHVLYDLTGVSLGHILKAATHMSSVKKENEFFCNGLNIPLTGIHIINSSSIAEPLMNFLRPMLNSELLDLITFYTPEEMSKLYKIIPQNILPEELGGDAGTIKELLENAVEDLCKKQKYLNFVESKVVNEQLRMGKSKFSQESYGVQGSFKNLSLD